MRNKIAKALATVSAVVCGLTGIPIDLGTHTHVFNPDWPPHARYHAVMFVFLCLAVSLVTLWLIWSAPGTAARDRRRTLLTIVLLLASMWLGFFVGLVVPGASANIAGTPQPLGIPANVLSAVVGLAVVPLIYVLERRTLDGPPGPGAPRDLP